MWTKGVFQKYVGIINNRNHYLNLEISRNYDERISSLYGAINQDELVASVMEYPSTLNQLYMSKMREFYHLSNSTYIFWEVEVRVLFAFLIKTFCVIKKLLL